MILSEADVWGEPGHWSLADIYDWAQLVSSVGRMDERVLVLMTGSLSRWPRVLAKLELRRRRRLERGVT